MPEAKISNYKVPPEDFLDLLDLATVADSYSIVKRCPGGRYIIAGYVCTHCGVDTSKVIEKNGKRYRRCGQPKEKMLETDMSDRLYGVFPMDG